MANEAQNQDPILEELNGEFVRVEVIAHLFGVTVRQVQLLTQEGIIESHKVEGARGRQYRLGETIQRYVAHLKDKAYGRTANNKEAALKQAKLEAEVALKESQAELHRIKTEIATGDYISREEVMLDYQKFFSTFKRFALSIPTRLIGMVGDQIRATDISRTERELSEEVTRMLRAFVVAGNEPPADDKPKKRAPRKKAAK